MLKDFSRKSETRPTWETIGKRCNAGKWYASSFISSSNIHYFHTDWLTRHNGKQSFSGGCRTKLILQRTWMSRRTKNGQSIKRKNSTFLDLFLPPCLNRSCCIITLWDKEPDGCVMVRSKFFLPCGWGILSRVSEKHSQSIRKTSKQMSCGLQLQRQQQLYL